MVTDNIGDYVRDKGINITRIAEATGISYQILYRAFNKDDLRQLKADELLLVCRFLEVNPYDFMDKSRHNKKKERKIKQ